MKASGIPSAVGVALYSRTCEKYTGMQKFQKTLENFKFSKNIG
jgi:hypothetical protein